MLGVARPAPTSHTALHAPPYAPPPPAQIRLLYQRDATRRLLAQGAAFVLQRWWRRQRLLLAMRRKSRQLAACVLQRFVRRALARHRDRAACVIQRRWRARLVARGWGVSDPLAQRYGHPRADKQAALSRKLRPAPVRAIARQARVVQAGATQQKRQLRAVAQRARVGLDVVAAVSGMQAGARRAAQRRRELTDLAAHALPSPQALRLRALRIGSVFSANARRRLQVRRAGWPWGRPGACIACLSRRRAGERVGSSPDPDGP